MTDKLVKPPPNTNYKTFILHSHRFSVGNDIMVKAGKADKGADFIARLDRIFTNKEGEVMLDARWYYRPEDTKAGRQPWHGVDEIIESDHKDTYHVRCVNSMAKVIGVDEYIERRQAQAEADKHAGGSAKKKAPLVEALDVEPAKGATSGGTVLIPVLYCRSFYQHRKGTLVDKVPNAKGSKTPVNPDLLSWSPKKPVPPLLPNAQPRKRAKIEKLTASPKPEKTKIEKPVASPKPVKTKIEKPAASSKPEKTKTKNSPMSVKAETPVEHIKETSGVVYSVKAIRAEIGGVSGAVTSSMVGLYTNLDLALKNAAVAFRSWSTRSVDGVPEYFGQVDAANQPYYIDRSADGDASYSEGTAVFETFATQNGVHTKIVVEAIKTNVDIDGEPFSHAPARPV